MTNDPTTPTSKADILAELIEGSRAALERAYKRAEMIAAQTGTPLVVMIDGEIVKVEPSLPRSGPR